MNGNLKGKWIARNGFEVEVTGFNEILQMWCGSCSVFAEQASGDHHQLTFPLFWDRGGNFTLSDEYKEWDLMQKLPEKGNYASVNS